MMLGTESFSPVKVIDEQGHRICAVEELPAGKRGTKVVEHCRRVVVVVEGGVLLHVKLLSPHLQMIVTSGE